MDSNSDSKQRNQKTHYGTISSASAPPEPEQEKALAGWYDKMFLYIESESTETNHRTKRNRNFHVVVVLGPRVVDRPYAQQP